MKKSFKVLVLFGVVVLLCSCASVPRYPYGKGEITIHLKGDSRLNLYDGSPHTLVLCTYQLRDPNAFNQLADEKDGLSKLLEGSRFDSSVTYYKMLILNPGQDLSEILDRAEGTTYVGFVAGYYLLEKNRVVRLYEIPLSRMSKNPEKLKIDLYLGPQEIQDMKRK
jgi:type VI secretion system VasD/TssJ family lipoprotein